MRSTLSRRAFLGMTASTGAALALAGCGQGQQKADSVNQGDSSGAESGRLTEPLDNGYSKGLHHATIEVEGQGTISLELNATIAPITVSNFADLVMQGFYDGLTFHRIIDGFMIQGGDPNGDGTGGSGHAIKGEFSKNGVVNAISHTRGTISMARSNDPDSGSSQFFIMQADNTSLDGQYAAFGRVTDGMDVVDALAHNTPVQDDNGTVAHDDQPKIAAVTMVD